jgi:hypothetical protein
LPWLSLTANLDTLDHQQYRLVECASEDQGRIRAKALGFALDRRRYCTCGCGDFRSEWILRYFADGFFDGPYHDIRHADDRVALVATRGVKARLGSAPHDNMMTVVRYESPEDYAVANRLHHNGRVSIHRLDAQTPTNTAISACPECNGTDPRCDLCVEISRPVEPTPYLRPGEYRVVMGGQPEINPALVEYFRAMINRESP